MRKLLLLFLAVSLTGTITVVSALADDGSAKGTLAAEDQDALSETIKMLGNPDLLRDSSNGDGLKALDSIDKLTQGDPAAKARINGLSSRIFEDLVKQSNGKPEEILRILQEGQKDPQLFMNRLTPAQKAELKGLAAEIDRNKKTH